MAVNFGGHMRFTYGGVPLVIRGKFERDATNMEAGIITNEDGSIAQTGKPQAQKFTVDFQDSDPTSSTGKPIDWQAVVFGGPYNIMVAEENTGVTHTYAGAQFGGKPKIDRLTGAVSGVEVHCPRDGYSVTSG